MNKDSKKALIDLLQINRERIGKPHNATKVSVAKLKNGTLEEMRSRIIELEEKLGMTNDCLYNLTSLFKSYLEEMK
jgi:hypothetical protein